MSRGAIVNALVSCGALLKAYGIGRGRVWLLLGVVAISAVLLVPDAIWTRFVFQQPEGQRETRVSFYISAWEAVEDYLFLGVGAGNYFTKWGFDHGFGHGTGSHYQVYVVHNIFLQVLINWGLISFLAFLAMIWSAYRCLPRPCGKDVLALGMLGIVVSLLLLTPFHSEFYYKGFSFGLGMLVAYQRWLGRSNLQSLRGDEVSPVNGIV
jgi:O-antigen ligase